MDTGAARSPLPRLFAGHGKQAVKDWAEVPEFACGFSPSVVAGGGLTRL
jgi:hypothetical protein